MLADFAYCLRALLLARIKLTVSPCNAIAISTTVSHRAQEREGGTQWRLASVPVRPTEGGFVNSLPWSRVRLVSRDGSWQPVVIGIPVEVVVMEDSGVYCSGWSW